VFKTPTNTLELEESLKRQIAAALVTRYDIPYSEAKKIIPESLKQWGKVLRLGGDLMHASLVVQSLGPSRDMTFVRVSSVNGFPNL